MKIEYHKDDNKLVHKDVAVGKINPFSKIHFDFLDRRVPSSTQELRRSFSCTMLAKERLRVSTPRKNSKQQNTVFIKIPMNLSARKYPKVGLLSLKVLFPN